MNKIIAVILVSVFVIALLYSYSNSEKDGDVAYNNANTQECEILTPQADLITLPMTQENQKEYLEENKKREGVTETPSGLQYEVLTSCESGESPVLASMVQVHYHGTTIDGNVFDSSVDRGVPTSFPLGAVIEGWQEGLQLMKVGEKFKFTIPADIAYGDSSPSPAIPAGATLIFDVELLGIQ